MSDFQHIVVYGGGTMGQGIAELLSKKGFEVTVIEKTRALANQARHHIELSLNKQLSKWGITQAEKKIILSRIDFTNEDTVLERADLVIETVTEDLQEKKKVFDRCDRFCPMDAILSSNTSTLSLTELAAVTRRPQRVIGLHFLHPITRLDLVEVVRGLKTEEETVRRIRQFLEKLHLTAIEVHESPGFVTTRLIVILINEALYTLMEGVATPEDIDTAMIRGYQFPYGPLEMADRFGLDSVLASMERLFREYGDPKFRPAPLLKKMVWAGQLGVKTGEGFFRYDEDGDRLREDVR
ncbi:3-hydroxybutyryl-CoA dehydrogenase [Melghirimyces profundicolus]|uniref:3-hydroxybutyryl-CoA dehydrogenase n=1 Tax=Melghirimyces profundicolus TaxID=1242148 RepID=A0A2T6BV45_9BACL|nr:3-hydroxyacyl-CoA dehydrogenase NAD-binding domain-containing protein [Melghirimyces profundicolus]PTX59951.1 3-hydroxybutyryl-CoA dehydrogenase [Melghirimyces profundicolus]